MKCLINCGHDSDLWTHKIFPGTHPYLLKILNKPLIEYYIDFCVLTGIKDIRISSDSSEEELRNFLADGTQWGVNISYSMSKPGDNLKNIILKNKQFTENDKLLLINNLIFINYDKNQSDYNLDKLINNTVIFSNKQNGGIYLISDFEKLAFTKMDKYKDLLISANSINSVKDYFSISMNLLENGTKKFVIPGYSSEDNIFIGQNVEITKLTHINSKTSIGNNVRLNDSTIGPNAIIGSNALVDKKTKVNNSIIYDNTYIGSGLEIFDKIIYKKRIIDPESGESLEVPDDFIISKLKKVNALDKIERIIFWLIAIVLFSIQLPFYIILILPARITRNKLLCRVSKDNEETELLNFITKEKSNFINGLFFKLSLHKFPLIIKVLIGKLYLTGNTPLSRDKCDLLEDMSIYRPAAFTINDMMPEANSDPFVKEINELFFSNNSSIGLDFKIFFKSLIQNLLN